MGRQNRSGARPAAQHHHVPGTSRAAAMYTVANRQLAFKNNSHTVGQARFCVAGVGSRDCGLSMLNFIPLDLISGRRFMHSQAQ